MWWGTKGAKGLRHAVDGPTNACVMAPAIALIVERCSSVGAQVIVLSSSKVNVDGHIGRGVLHTTER